MTDDEIAKALLVVHETPVKATTVREVLTLWEAHLEAEDSKSLIDVRSTHKTWTLRALGDEPVASLTPKKVGLVCEVMLRAGRSNNTARKFGSFLHTAMTWAHNKGHIDQNPIPTLAGVLPKKGTRKAHGEKVIPPDPLRAFLRCDRIPIHDRLLYALAATTGARQGEIINVKKSSIRNGTLYLDSQYSTKRRRVDTPKTNESRSMPVRDDMIEGLEFWVHVGRPEMVGAKTEDDDLLFVNMVPVAKGFRHFQPARLMSDTVLARVKKHLSLSGFHEPRVFHSLRHSFVALMIDAGVSKDVAEQFTHPRSSGRTIDIYTHYSDRVLREAANTPRLDLPRWSLQLEFPF